MDSIEQFISNLSRLSVPKGSNLELELRFIIDSRKQYDINSKTYHLEQTIDIVKQLIKKYSKNPATIEQTINFIAGEKIKQMNFVRGEQQKDKHSYYSKTRIIEPIFFAHSNLPAYRLNVSYETAIPEFPIKDTSFARVRLRYCISLGDWRLDITLVKNVSSFSNPAILKDAKNALLFNIELDNFVDKAPWKSTDTIEFELEYIGDQAAININKLLIGNTLFDGILDSNDAGNTGYTNTTDTALQSSMYQVLIYQVAKYIKPKQSERFKRDYGMKQLSNQVIELDVNIYMKELHKTITNYYITDKLDGRRAVCYLTPDGCYALTDKETALPIKTNHVYIVDTEFYDDKYYIFDVMVYKDETISDKPFSERLTYFDKVIEDFADSKLFTTKSFIKLNENYIDQLRKFKKEKKPYTVDGIVLTPESGEYDSMRVYKYKPTEHLTVDFLIKKCPDKLLGIKPYIPTKDKPNLYLLFCGINKNVYIRLGMRLIRIDELFPGLDYKNLPSYFPVQFQPSDKTFAYIFWSDKEGLDGEVGEFSCIGDKYTPCHWHLHRIRDDRKVEVLRGSYFGNNYKVAEFVWMSYKTPLVIEDIAPTKEQPKTTTSPANNYFQEHDNQLQKASRNFNSFVKATILGQFRNTEWIMDVASGKGQDLFRYGSIGTRNLICLEIDQMALMELIARKHEFAGIKERGAMNIQIHQLDVNNDYKNNIEKLTEINIPNHGVDLIICNFAFHYFLANRKNLINVIKFINNYLKPGGRFIFTAFDGREIIQLLNENSGDWTIKVAGETQYSIRKQYEISFLDTIGQKIEVMLPFSKSAYYQEYLVNIDYIAGEFASVADMVLEVDQGFAEYLDDYKRVNRNNYNTMTDADKKYVSNYHYYCFYKKIPATSGSSARRGRK